MVPLPHHRAVTADMAQISLLPGTSRPTIVLAVRPFEESTQCSLRLRLAVFVTGAGTRGPWWLRTARRARG